MTITYIDETQTNRYWLSHGGIPVSSHNNILQIDYNKRCQLVFENKYPFSIRWGDYSSNIGNFEYDYVTHRPKISPKLLLKFLKLNEIDFAIRGHTDDLENAYLFSNISSINKKFDDVFPLNQQNIYDLNHENRNISDMNKKIIFPSQSMIFDNPYIPNIKQTNYPIAQIRTKNWYHNNKYLVKMINSRHNPSKYIIQPNILETSEIEVYPLLTISTNSDIARSLNKDCFAILNINSNHDGRLYYEPTSLLNELQNKSKNEL